MTRAMRFVLLLPLLAAACGGNPTAPDATATETSAGSLSVFAGTLDPNGAKFYSFTVSNSGAVTAYLASLTLVGQREALTVPVRLGIGVPRGEGCSVTASVDTSPALVTQLTTTLSAGIYCMNISDIGVLPGPAAFVIRFRYS